MAQEKIFVYIVLEKDITIALTAEALAKSIILVSTTTWSAKVVMDADTSTATHATDVVTTPVSTATAQEITTHKKNQS